MCIRDRHTAIAVKVARDHADPVVPMITLSTAHPAKFCEAVHDATGEAARPPAWGAVLSGRTETVAHLASDRARVEEYILQHARLTRDTGQSLTFEGVTS